MRNEPEKADARWHPATKLLLGTAVLAIPYLWWTGSQPEGGVAAPVERVAQVAPGPAEPSPAALEPYALPPLERFAAVVERPLFSPTRRMPPIPEPSAEPQSEADGAAATEAGPSGPAEPDLHFFGTVRDRGQMAALVTFPATNAVARLAPGDRVGEWEVVEVARDRLVLGVGEDRRSFEIFGPNAGGGKPPKRTARKAAHAPPPQPAAEAAPPEEPNAVAAPPEEPNADAGPSEELAPPYEEPEADGPTADGPAADEPTTDPPAAQ